MYKTMIASALFFGLLTIAYLQQKRNVPKKIVFLFAVLELIMCLCTSLLTNFVLTKGQYIRLNSSGAALGMLLGAYIFTRITPKYKEVFFESFVVALPLMYGVAKIGCAFAGCCEGLPYDGFMRVHTDKGNLFPIQKLESAVFLLLFAFSIVLYFKKHFNPLVASSIYAIAKIALDFLRYAHLYHVITATQVMCVVIVVLFIFLNRRQAKTTKLYSDE